MNSKKSSKLHIDVEFENLGKIKKANIQLRPFTVIAGCNSSGKSFITKSLYSLFSYDPERDAQIWIEELNKAIDSISQYSNEKDESEKLKRGIKRFQREKELLNLNISEISSKPELAQYFLDNFMTQHLDQLIHSESKKADINIQNIGSAAILKNTIEIEQSVIDGVKSINPHPPIYLESPTYWKLSDALKNSKSLLKGKANKRGLKESDVVTQAPKYFYDVVDLLEIRVKNTVFDDVAEKLEKVIKGNLSISNGNIQFNDNTNGQSIGLSLTALGVTNVGMLALLLKQGAILPGTFLFIDEPEVHLHPAWQVVFVKALYELSKRGVNVVIASHSIDIMKAIENLMENDDDQQNHFGINQLTQDGYSVNNSIHNLKRLAAISEDLGNSFYEMTMESWNIQ